MKHILFSILLAGMMAAVQAAEPQCGGLPNVDVDVHGSRVYLTIRGQSAKEIFKEMPESSKQAPNVYCGLNNVIKVKGGFVCRFVTDENDPACAYSCSVDMSAKTGKTAVRKKYDTCDEPEP